jgi:hypothetical protein
MNRNNGAAAILGLIIVAVFAYCFWIGARTL